MPSFDPIQHTYNSPEFANDLDEAVTFFIDTPVHKLPTRDAPNPDTPPPFSGPGVYALYYRGDCPIYTGLAKVNRDDCIYPIYVGSALPQGWRKARATIGNARTLYNRLRQHAGSIASTTGDRPLNVNDFWCRFMIMKDPESKMITTVESQLIYQYRPLWNSYIDGFGNHDVGAFRAGGKLTQWDTLHSGRYRRGTAAGKTAEDLIKIIEEVQARLGAS